MYVILNINQVDIVNTPQVLQKFLEQLISEGGPNILRRSRYWFPSSLSSKWNIVFPK